MYRSVLVPAILLLLTSVSFSQVAVVSPAEARKWDADLSFLVNQMKTIHPNMYHSISRQAFERNVSNLRNRIPKLTRNEIIVELKRVVASIDDGHSGLPLVFNFHGMTSKTDFRELPLRLYVFSDGVFVTEASQDYKSLVGKRVIGVGSLSIEAAIEKLSKLVSKDNEMTAMERVPGLLIIPEVLQALKITKDPSKATIITEENGLRKTHTVAPLKSHDSRPWKKANEGSGAPLWLSNTKNPYWYRLLEDKRTAYFQFNAVENKKDGESIKDFVARMFADIRKNAIERLVIDLRQNTGGNGVLNWPLIYEIIRSDKINQKGNLFVITGRKTFSAATHTAVLLDLHTKAIIVGEPSSGNINAYGDHKPFMLPNSGLLAFVSKYYHQHTYPWDKRKMLKPDIPVATSFNDFRKNKDAALDSISNYRDKPD